MYSNMKYYETICNCLRVIQQYINRKLKSANCWQRTSLNVSKQKLITLLDGVDVGTPKWRVSTDCLIVRVHEAVSNVKVHLMTRSGNVNMTTCYITLSAETSNFMTTFVTTMQFSLK